MGKRVGSEFYNRSMKTFIYVFLHTEMYTLNTENMYT